MNFNNLAVFCFENYIYMRNPCTACKLRCVINAQGFENRCKIVAFTMKMKILSSQTEQLSFLWKQNSYEWRWKSEDGRWKIQDLSEVRKPRKLSLWKIIFSFHLSIQLTDFQHFTSNIFKVNHCTETNDNSFESPVIVLFAAERTRVWQYLCTRVLLGV